MALDLGKLLSESVPKMGTEERIEYIPLDRLVGDERNFYALSDIDALAANIELIGLQQPIRVREVSGNPEQFRIVSGHRRHAAIRKLVEEGNKTFERVPCIIETVECSEAMQELRLIYANSDTRKMSPADLSRQAVRVEELFYQLKEEGYEFPGRMRDHVAQACQTTKSKLSRLKVIREKLHPMLMPDWDEGRLSEAVAYRIAQESEKVQNQLFSNNGHAPRSWTFDRADREIDKIKGLLLPVTPLDFCKLDAKTAANDYLTKWEEESSWFFAHMKEHIFEDFIGGLTVIPTRHDGVNYLKDYCSGRGSWGAVRYESSKTGLEVYKDTRGNEKTKRSWTEVWDTMACVALQRCAAEHNRPKKKEQPTTAWMPGSQNPDKPCEAVVVFDLGENQSKQLCIWNGSSWVFKNGAKIDMEPARWLALPKEESKC